MKRRTFLQSLGAFSLTPIIPAPVIAAAPAAQAAVAKDTYMWAETIVRAHNKCNLGMLQRLLQIDNATATALKSQLMKNGVISAHANAYGMHTAVKPLYEGAFMRPTSEIGKLKNPLNSIDKKDSEIKILNDEDESISDPVESNLEDIDSETKDTDSSLDETNITATLKSEETDIEHEFDEGTIR